MPEIKSVKWTEHSLVNALEISKWIGRKFSEKEVQKFKKLLVDFEKIIQQFPEMFPLSSIKTDVSQAVVHKNLSIYFSRKGDKIVVVAMRDNRQKKIL
jgi:plasmid stabilization system protein ParE